MTVPSRIRQTMSSSAQAAGAPRVPVHFDFAPGSADHVLADSALEQAKQSSLDAPGVGAGKIDGRDQRLSLLHQPLVACQRLRPPFRHLALLVLDPGARHPHGLAFKLAAKGIRANSVSPGNTYFDGGIWQNIENNLPDLYAEALALNPTGRMARPEEIARGVVFLASPASSFTTGTNLVIYGALTTKGVQL